MTPGTLRAVIATADTASLSVAQEFARLAKIPVGLAQTTLLLLSELKIVLRTGKQGNAYIYELND